MADWIEVESTQKDQTWIHHISTCQSIDWYRLIGGDVWCSSNRWSDTTTDNGSEFGRRQLLIVPILLQLGGSFRVLSGTETPVTAIDMSGLDTAKTLQPFASPAASSQGATPTNVSTRIYFNQSLSLLQVSTASQRGRRMMLTCPTLLPQRKLGMVRCFVKKTVHTFVAKSTF